MYRSDRKFPILIIVFVCFLSLSIGLAALSANLEIGLSGEIKGGTFDIHFENLVKVAGLGNEPVVSGTEINDLSVSFPYRGTYTEYTVDVVNDGTFDAFLVYYDVSDSNSITCSGGTVEENFNVCKYITISVTDINGNAFPSGNMVDGSYPDEVLNKNGGVKHLKIRIDYDKDDLVTPSELVNKEILISDIKITMIYGQGNGSSNDVN